MKSIEGFAESWDVFRFLVGLDVFGVGGLRVIFEGLFCLGIRVLGLGVWWFRGSGVGV